jgi:hypothetical protein
LSPQEQIEIIQYLTESLSMHDSQLSAAARAWRPKTLAQLVREHKKAPIKSVSALAADFWPPDESADDIISYIYTRRVGDLAIVTTVN